MTLLKSVKLQSKSSVNERRTEACIIYFYLKETHPELVTIFNKICVLKAKDFIFHNQHVTIFLCTWSFHSSFLLLQGKIYKPVLPPFCCHRAGLSENPAIPEGSNFRQ